jgi:hypothetical protein
MGVPVSTALSRVIMGDILSRGAAAIGHEEDCHPDYRYEARERGCEARKSQQRSAERFECK